MIHFRQVRKKYPASGEVLNIEALEIEAGQCLGLLGNNGAGKSTFFKALLDLVPLDTGTITIKEEPVVGNDRWKSEVGSFLDTSFLIPFLRPEEYFEFVGRTYGLSIAGVRQRLPRFASFFREEILGRGRYIRDLSKGNQAKVGIAAALLVEPQILILDEPFAHLDPSSRMELNRLLRTFQKEQEATILLSSHNLDHIHQLCERILLLEKGRVLKDLLGEEQTTIKEINDYFATP